MRPRRVAAVVTSAAAALLLLSGCVTEGTVVAKSHDPGVRTCSGSGKNRSCSRNDECWELTLRDTQGQTGDVCIGFWTWRNVKVGSHYSGGTPKW